MTKQIFKAVAVGAVFGLALYAIPFFLLKAVVIVLLMGFIFRMIAYRRMAGRHFGPGYAFAGGPMKHRFQQMSEEERKAFFDKMKHHGCGHGWKQESSNPESDNK
ncbi:MAG: hypothetical protein IPL92_09005 [Saprospiraceae bacterium]|nr:hypothetical protein [Candidatus Opimibacter iunctus]